MRTYRYGQMYGTARLTDIAEHQRLPFEVLDPTFARLTATGYLQRDGDQMWLTEAGGQQLNYVYSLLMAWIVDKLSRSPGFDGARTAAKSKLRCSASRIVFWPNVIGTMTRRRWRWPAADASGR